MTTDLTAKDDAERGEMCIGTVHFDPDSAWADVMTIDEILSNFGYGVTMAPNNSHLIITRDKEFKPNFEGSP